MFSTVIAVPFTSIDLRSYAPNFLPCLNPGASNSLLSGTGAGSSALLCVSGSLSLLFSGWMPSSSAVTFEVSTVSLFSLSSSTIGSISEEIESVSASCVTCSSAISSEDPPVGGCSALPHFSSFFCVNFSLLCFLCFLSRFFGAVGCTERCLERSGVSVVADLFLAKDSVCDCCDFVSCSNNDESKDLHA